MKKLSIALCLMMALAIGFTFTAERSAAASGDSKATAAYLLATSGKKGFISVQRVKGSKTKVLLWTNKQTGKYKNKYLASYANLYVYKKGKIKQVNTTFKIGGKRMNALKTKKKYKIGMYKKKMVVFFKGGVCEFSIKNTKIKGKVVWRERNSYYSYKIANGKASKAKRVSNKAALKYLVPLIKKTKYPLFTKINW